MNWSQLVFHCLLLALLNLQQEIDALAPLRRILAGQTEVVARLLSLLHFVRLLKNLGLRMELMRHYGVLLPSRWKAMALTMAVGGALSILATPALTRPQPDQHGACAAAEGDIAMPMPMPICRLKDDQALASVPQQQTPLGRHEAGPQDPHLQLVLPACRISDGPAACRIDDDARRGWKFPATSASTEWTSTEWTSTEWPTAPLLDIDRPPANAAAATTTAAPATTVTESPPI